MTEVNKMKFMANRPGTVNTTEAEGALKETCMHEPDNTKGRDFAFYAPGNHIGWEGRVRQDVHTFEESELKMKISYNNTRSNLDPTWQEIRPAAYAAWTDAKI